MSFSFDAYEYLAFVIPGSVLLLGLMFLFPWVREHVGPAAGTSFDLAGLGAFVIVSFVLGHLLQGVGRNAILGEALRGVESAYATNSIFKGEKEVLGEDDQKLLFGCVGDRLKIKDLKILPAVKPDEMPRVPATTPQMIVDANAAAAKERAAREERARQEKDNLPVWRATVNRIYSDLRALDRTKVSERMQRDYALHLQLASALILLAGCAVLVGICQLVAPRWAIHLRVDKTPIGLRVVQVVLLAVCAIIALDRMQRFDKSFARELYTTFINTCMPTPKS